MEVHDVLRSDSYAVSSGRVEVPALQHFQNLLFHTVAHSLQQLGVDYVTLRVDGDFHDHVALNPRRQVGARDGRVGINNREMPEPPRRRSEANLVHDRTAIRHGRSARGRRARSLPLFPRAWAQASAAWVWGSASPAARASVPGAMVWPAPAQLVPDKQ